MSISNQGTETMTDQTAIDQPAAQPKDALNWDWACVEIFGHRQHFGRCREEERFGAKMLRVDVPTFTPDRTLFDSAQGRPEQPEIVWTTHFYGGSAIFSYTPTDEASVMKANRPYERPMPKRLAAPVEVDEGDDDDLDERPF